MAESMQGKSLGVQTHVLETQFEPPVILVPLNHREVSLAVGDLEHRVTPPASLLAVNINQTENGLNGAKQLILGSS